MFNAINSTDVDRFTCCLQNVSFYSLKVRFWGIVLMHDFFRFSFSYNVVESLSVITNMFFCISVTYLQFTVEKHTNGKTHIKRGVIQSSLAHCNNVVSVALIQLHGCFGSHLLVHTFLKEM